MFAREKDAKQKSDDRIHETVTPLSDMSGTTAVLPNPTEKPTGISVARVTAPTPTPTPTSTLTPTPMTGVRDGKSEAKNDTKRLTVGRGISLNGKISFCDRLVIDGKVEAELEDCHTVEVTENGTFKGAAEITGAEISGHYDGSLTVRENLLIRGTGRVSGTVRYGKLHIEDGGEINGDVKSIASDKK
ncbi:MAG TPA: polymer-forming cytoskeletal protein [Stellaceae bacterium]|jgi:cytoskeletal protein CcmA (bactofilin family)|nr:polymer-forming cytoskeletal protein [Stellaceae bacterium]